MSWNNQSAMGQAFEELIILANQRYKREKVAVIHKVPTAWIPLRGKDGKICSAKVDPGKKAAVDFLGNYAGQAIAFDAKHTDNERRISWSVLDPDQEDFLRSWEQTGGVAFVLVEWQLKGILLVPIQEWGREGKSLLLPEAPMEWRVRTRGGLPDYLENLKEVRVCGNIRAGSFVDR